MATDPTQINKFQSDGNFLQNFLNRPPEQLIPPCDPPTCPARTAPECDDASSYAPADPPPATQSGSRRRKFTEVAVDDTSKKRRRRWDNAAVVTATNEDVEPKSAADRQFAAVRHLNPHDTPKEKDTYDDCLDKGGAIEGGTWEHQRRAREMIQTANLADAVTSLAGEATARRTGIASYLPTELLEVFEEKCSKVKSGEEVDDVLQPKEKSIESSNKGFKMLQRAGWKEGQGLGAAASGITEPVRATGKTVLGEMPAHQPTKNDDAFDQYRKRMMLAYRFRPNPLNNPRRSYDGYATLYDKDKRDAMFEKICSIKQQGEGG